MAKGRRDEAAEVAAEVAEESPALELQDEITLKNGIRLKLRSVPLFLVQEAASRIKEPEVPIVYNADKERDEENPDNPAYQEAVARVKNDRIEAGMDVMFLLGTELLHVPDGMFRPEDDAWLETLEVLGLSDLVSSPSQKLRYLQWLKFYAFDRGSDMSAVYYIIGAKSGVVEEEVMKALESFRGGEGRNATNGVRAG